MEQQTIVIALGGNALQVQGEAPTSENEIKNVEVAVKSIAKVIQKGYNVVITHGNGPQVGRLLLQSQKAESYETPAFDLDVCGALSQGLIGYHIQQCLENELKKLNIKKSVATVITQVEVDKEDTGFKNPSKPIGPFYTEQQKDDIIKNKGYNLKEDAGRGYRRVVASPSPKRIVEIQAIKSLIKEGNVVICCGGGGVPVINKGDKLRGIAAVIDKDNVSSLLAQNINADKLVILTAVKEVSINFKKPDQIDLNKVDVAQMEQYILQNQFAPGSMLPKVKASIDFVNKTGNCVIITTLDNILNTLENEDSGTVISK